MSAKHAALGFKLHTGWAAVVAAARTRDRIEILLRRRIELLPNDGSVPRFVYHEAAEVPLTDAKRLLKRTGSAARESAHTAIAAIVAELRVGGVTIDAAGVAAASTALPSDLSRILAAHTMIHSAEGVLFQEAVADTCEARGLKVLRIRERDLWPKLGEAATAEIDGLRGLIGPPWGADQKTAAGLALAALGVPLTQKA